MSLVQVFVYDTVVVHCMSRTVHECTLASLETYCMSVQLTGPTTFLLGNASMHESSCHVFYAHVVHSAYNYTVLYVNTKVKVRLYPLPLSQRTQKITFSYSSGVL
jgi:hypothetical protein